MSKICRDVILGALLLAGSAAMPVGARADGDGVYVGLAAARVQDRFGPFILPLEGDAREARGHAFDESANSVAVELSVPVSRWFSVDAIVIPAARSSRNEIWPVFFDPAPPDPLPTSTGVVVATETRALGVAAAMRTSPVSGVTLYGKLGALWMESTAEITPRPPGTGFRQVVRDRDVSPWLALGARYRFFSGFTVTAEIGARSEGARVAVVGLGWTGWNRGF